MRGPSPTQLADPTVENSHHLSLPPFIPFSPKGGGTHQAGDSLSTAGSPVAGDGAMVSGPLLMHGMLYAFLPSTHLALGALELPSLGNCLLPSLCSRLSERIGVAPPIFSLGGLPKMCTLASSLS